MSTFTKTITPDALKQASEDYEKAGGGIYTRKASRIVLARIETALVRSVELRFKDEVILSTDVLLNGGGGLNMDDICSTADLEDCEPLFEDDDEISDADYVVDWGQAVALAVEVLASRGFKVSVDKSDPVEDKVVIKNTWSESSK